MAKIYLGASVYTPQSLAILLPRKVLQHQLFFNRTDCLDVRGIVVTTLHLAMDGGRRDIKIRGNCKHLNLGTQEHMDRCDWTHRTDVLPTYPITWVSVRTETASRCPNFSKISMHLSVSWLLPRFWRSSICRYLTWIPMFYIIPFQIQKSSK